MNAKLTQLAENLQDGGVITGYLEDDAIALLGRLSYDEILEAVGNRDDATNIFWAAAQFLAGDPDIYELMSITDENTPQECADTFCRKKQEEVAV